MMQIHFSKMQGIGNDFVVCAADQLSGADASQFAQFVCSRHYGVGSDGLLIVAPSEAANHVIMRMYNADGTPDVCGNGMRCVSRWSQRHGLISGHRLAIETIDGLKMATLHDDGNVTVDMGRAKYEPTEVPYLADSSAPLHVPFHGRDITIHAVSTGSTHTVWFCDELPDDELFTELGPNIENHPLFPLKTSLMCTLPVSKEQLQLRIWERGVGETLGCGTGACAAAVVAMDNGYVESRVRVRSKGGEVTVERLPEGSLTLTGEAVLVYEGVVTYDPDRLDHLGADLG